MSEKWGRIPTMKDYPIDPCDRAECAELKSRLAAQERVIETLRVSMIEADGPDGWRTKKMAAQEKVIERYRKALMAIALDHTENLGNPTWASRTATSALQEGEGVK